ncbi:unnamed protein product [Pleuronectes platessa]|uniref:Uncharacterized protein n=1 Tax=Pleuronectes platessa TaxID=8262 RepID=A0A9N7UNJ0_PLEPL|nr:unnamed protein product [Pleuronectes platessa]
MLALARTTAPTSSPGQPPRTTVDPTHMAPSILYTASTKPPPPRLAAAAPSLSRWPPPLAVTAPPPPPPCCVSRRRRLLLSYRQHLKLLRCPSHRLLTFGSFRHHDEPASSLQHGSSNESHWVCGPWCWKTPNRCPTSSNSYTCCNWDGSRYKWSSWYEGRDPKWHCWSPVSTDQSD